MMKKILPWLVLALAACNGGGGGHDDDDIDAKDVAVIAAHAPDFSSGGVELVDVDAPHDAQQDVVSTGSDVVVRADGDHYFLLERFMADRISRYEAATPGTKTWGPFSTNDASEPGVLSNPYDLIVASPTKAYLLRYGSPKLWIVDPSATTEAGFKQGEIDLSAYDDAGPPEMAAGIIRDGKLFVVMQRLNGFDVDRDSYVAVIDVATDMEITTGDPAPALPGIQLPDVRNASSILATPDGDLLVLATGDFAGSFNGGIARIDTTSYAVSTIVDDGDGTTHPFGQPVDMAIADDHRAYFIGDTNFTTQTLYRFDPAGGSAPVAVTGFVDGELSTVAVSPGGALFVGLSNFSVPGVAILGFSGGAETVEAARVDTGLTPGNIDFMTVETAAAP